MKIGGFQKMTLLDYPGKVAATVFTEGCNFRCPFCHNASLVVRTGGGEHYSAEEVLSYLKKRTGLLDGVCITGGEPLLQSDIEEFIAEIKALGFSVKLDTNGYMPQKLKDLAKKGLIDYVAMDIKNSIEKYPQTAGVDNMNTALIEESIDFLLSGEVEAEFRTTVVKEFHDISDIEDIAKRIKGAGKYFLQPYVDSGDIIGDNLHPVDKSDLEEMCKAAAKYVHFVEIRG